MPSSPFSAEAGEGAVVAVPSPRPRASAAAGGRGAAAGDSCRYLQRTESSMYKCRSPRGAPADPSGDTHRRPSLTSARFQRMNSSRSNLISTDSGAGGARRNSFEGPDALANPTTPTAADTGRGPGWRGRQDAASGQSGGIARGPDNSLRRLSSAYRSVTGSSTAATPTSRGDVIRPWRTTPAPSSSSTTPTAGRPSPVPFAPTPSKTALPKATPRTKKARGTAQAGSADEPSDVDAPLTARPRKAKSSTGPEATGKRSTRHRRASSSVTTAEAEREALIGAALGRDRRWSTATGADSSDSTAIRTGTTTSSSAESPRQPKRTHRGPTGEPALAAVLDVSGQHGTATASKSSQSRSRRSPASPPLPSEASTSRNSARPSTTKWSSPDVSAREKSSPTEKKSGRPATHSRGTSLSLTAASNERSSGTVGADATPRTRKPKLSVRAAAPVLDVEGQQQQQQQQTPTTPATTSRYVVQKAAPPRKARGSVKTVSELSSSTWAETPTATADGARSGASSVAPGREGSRATPSTRAVSEEGAAVRQRDSTGSSKATPPTSQRSSKRTAPVSQRSSPALERDSPAPVPPRGTLDSPFATAALPPPPHEQRAEMALPVATQSTPTTAPGRTSRYASLSHTSGSYVDISDDDTGDGSAPPPPAQRNTLLPSAAAAELAGHGEEEFNSLLNEVTRLGGMSDFTGHSPLTPRQRIQIQTQQRLERERMRRRANPSRPTLRLSTELRNRGSMSARGLLTRSLRSSPRRDRSCNSTSTMTSAAATASRKDSQSTSVVAPESGATSKAPSPAVSPSRDSAARGVNGDDDWVTTQVRLIAPMLDGRSSDPLSGPTSALTSMSPVVLIQSGAESEAGGLTHRSNFPDVEEEEEECSSGGASAEKPPRPSTSSSSLRGSGRPSGSGARGAARVPSEGHPGEAGDSQPPARTPGAAKKRPALKAAAKKDADGEGSALSSPTATRASALRRQLTDTPQATAPRKGSPKTPGMPVTPTAGGVSFQTQSRRPSLQAKGARVDLHFPTPPSHVRQVLIPLLANAQEKERTATIVFDLDETLCNNHVKGPALLRPGVLQVLKHLRSLYPKPIYRPAQRMSATQLTTDRLYGDAMRHTGAAPLSARRGSRRLSAPHMGDDSAAKGDDASYEGLRLEIILWTASMESYARPVVARLDPTGTLFDQLIFRDVRWYSNMDYTKDLSRLGRSMERCVIVENAPASVYMNRHNAILVNDFISNRHDRQLLVVKVILTEWLTRVNKFVVDKRKEEAQAKLAEGEEPATPTGGEDEQAPHMSESTEAPSETASARGKDAKGPKDGLTVTGERNSTHCDPHSQESVHQRLSSQQNLVKRSTRPPTGGLAASMPLLAASKPVTPQEEVAITHFLSTHPYISPGTNYIRLSAAAHYTRLSLMRASGGSKGEEDDATARQLGTVDPRLAGSTRASRLRMRPMTRTESSTTATTTPTTTPTTAGLDRGLHGNSGSGGAKARADGSSLSSPTAGAGAAAACKAAAH